MRATEYWFDLSVWCAVFVVAGMVGGLWGLGTAAGVALWLILT